MNFVAQIKKKFLKEDLHSNKNISRNFFRLNLLKSVWPVNLLWRPNLETKNIDAHFIIKMIIINIRVMEIGVKGLRLVGSFEMETFSNLSY